MPVVLIVETIAVIVVSIGTPTQWHPWAQLVTAATVVAVLLVRFGDQSLLERLTKRRSLAASVEVADLLAADGSLVGCVRGRRLVATAIALDAGHASFTEVSNGNSPTYDGQRIPLRELSALVDHGDIRLSGIDVIVSSYQQADNACGDVYRQLIGSLPIVSSRKTVVILRFDLLAQSHAVSRRGHTAHATESAVTTTTERTRRALVQAGISARVLEATELAELHRCAIDFSGAISDQFVSGASNAVDPLEGDRLVLPQHFSPQLLDDLIGTPARRNCVTLRLTPADEARNDPLGTAVRSSLEQPSVAHVSVVIRSSIEGISLPTSPTLQLATVQDDCAGPFPAPASRVTARQRHHSATMSLEEVSGFSPPGHGCGPILGATARGAAAAIDLAGPHLRRVLFIAPAEFSAIFVGRIVATGRTIAIVSDMPRNWMRLVSAVGNPEILRLASNATASRVDAIVWDRADNITAEHVASFTPPGDADAMPPTIIRILDTALPDVETRFHYELVQRPNVVVDARSVGTVSVESPRFTGPLSAVTLPAEHELTTG